MRGQGGSTESAISYVLAMREKLSRMRELVQQNLGHSQAEQKVGMTKMPGPGSFELGEDVVVLLPTSASKLLAQWQGPYKIVQKVGRLNYKVDGNNKKKRKQVLHVNLLWK